jgi:hypothetical protein
MQTDPTAVVDTTAACTTARHSSCRGTVYTLTTGLGSPLSPCACACHEPAPVADDELDDLLAEDADRRNDELAIGAWS